MAHISPAFLDACPAVDGGRPASASLDVYVSVERLRGSFTPTLEEVLETSFFGAVIPVSTLATQDGVARAQAATVNEAVAQAGDALGTAIVTLDDKQVWPGRATLTVLLGAFPPHPPHHFPPSSQSKSVAALQDTIAQMQSKLTASETTVANLVADVVKVSTKSSVGCRVVV
jgi:hypothetical protein